MMMREDRIGQVVKVAAAGLAMVALTLALALMKPAPSDLIRAAPDASDACGPAHLANTLVALGVVDEVVDPEHAGSMFFSVPMSKSWGDRALILAPRNSY